jgi:hypothetical protein
MTWDAVGYMGRGRGKIADIAVIAANRRNRKSKKLTTD